VFVGSDNRALVTADAFSSGQTVAAVTGNVSGSVASVVGNIGGNLVGSAASVSGAVGSVAGNVSGNVSGSVNSVVTAVDISTTAAQRIWDALTSASVTAGSIGVKLKNWALGTDNRALVSADSHSSGVAVASVTGSVASVTNPVTLNNTQSIKKNTALNNFSFFMVDTAGAPKTGLTVTAQRSIDGAAFASCANAVSELGSGFYLINLAATDLNGNSIAFRFAASGAVDTALTILPVQP